MNLGAVERRIRVGEKGIFLCFDFLWRMRFLFFTLGKGGSA